MNRAASISYTVGVQKLLSLSVVLLATAHERQCGNKDYGWIMFSQSRLAIELSLLCAKLPTLIGAWNTNAHCSLHGMFASDRLQCMLTTKPK